jgi:hypothetical protein
MNSKNNSPGKKQPIPVNIKFNPPQAKPSASEQLFVDLDEVSIISYTGRVL